MKYLDYILIFLIISVSGCSKDGPSPTDQIQEFDDLGIEIQLSNIMFNINHPVMGRVMKTNPDLDYDYDISISTGSLITEKIETLYGLYDFYVKNLSVGEHEISIGVTLSDGRTLTKSYPFKVIEGFGVTDVWNNVEPDMIDSEHLGYPNCYRDFAYDEGFYSMLIGNVFGEYSFEFNNNGKVKSITVDGSNFKANVSDPFAISHHNYASLIKSTFPALEREAIGKYECLYYGKYLIELYQYRDENSRLIDMGDNHVRFSINPVRSHWP